VAEAESSRQSRVTQNKSVLRYNCEDSFIAEKSCRNSRFPECQAVVHPSELSIADVCKEVMRCKKIAAEKHPA